MVSGADSRCPQPMPTADARGATRKTMIVALARKLLVALWQLVTTGAVPRGVVLRAAA
jgi:transposase